MLDDVLADVFAIHRYLHDARDQQVNIVPARGAEPVRAERWALVRALALLLADAKRCARKTNAVVRAITESDEQWVSVGFHVGTPLVEDVPGPGRGRYCEGLAALLGGAIERKPGVALLRMASLHPNVRTITCILILTE